MEVIKKENIQENIQKNIQKNKSKFIEIDVNEKSYKKWRKRNN